MKRKNIIKIMVAAGMLALAGCNNDYGINADVNAGSITIEATIGQMTKVEHNGNTTRFTEGDTLLLYGWRNYSDSVPLNPDVDGVQYGYDGTAWAPQKQLFWDNSTDDYYFLGIYPVPDSVTGFKAAAYKLNPADYTASDLLIATNLDGVKATDGAVKLTFEHVMAKLNVNIKFRSEWSSTPVVNSVTVFAFDSASVNYLTKEVTAKGVEQKVQIPQADTPANGFDVSFSGLQVPQSKVRIIYIKIGTRMFAFESDLDITLKAGKFTTIDLIAGKDRIELDNITISDWTADSDLGCEDAVFVDPYNGHEYVDLGLPSGLKWATCNVGASKPEEYGDYFAWGDTVPYYELGHAQDDLQTYGKDDKKKTDGYDWSTYKWCEGSNKTLTKYCSESNYGYNDFQDSKTTLDAEDDAASYNWGGIWRMPTKADFDELSNTWQKTDDYTWTWCDGSTTKYAGTDVKGWQIVRISTGATLFLPAAGYRGGTSLNNVGYGGYYWSSSLDTGSSFNAYDLFIVSNGESCYDNFRYFGQSVRPVCP